MPAPDSIIQQLALEREERFLEFKQSCTWDDLKNKIAKTSMGMANIRDGGTIIIGVAERDGNYFADGIIEEDFLTFDSDNMQEYINSFADPYVQTEIYFFEHDNKKFIAIKVSEFNELPVICKKNGGDNLQKGAIYTRSYQKPETCKVSSQTEMREIIDIAVAEGVKRFVRTAERAKVRLVPEETPIGDEELRREETPSKTNEELFSEEIEGL